MNFKTRWMMAPIFFIGTLAGMELEPAPPTHLLNCYAAIQENKVEKLNTLLSNPEYESPLATIFEAPAPPISEILNFNPSNPTSSNSMDLLSGLATSHEPMDLLEVAIRNKRPECIKLIATLQGNLRQQEIDRLGLEGKNEKKATALANAKYIPFPYLSSLYLYNSPLYLYNQDVASPYTPSRYFELVRILIDNKLAFPNDILHIDGDEEDLDSVVVETPLCHISTVKEAEYLIEKGAVVQPNLSLLEKQHPQMKKKLKAWSNHWVRLSSLKACMENKHIDRTEKKKILLFLLRQGASANAQTFIQFCNKQRYDAAQALVDNTGFNTLFPSNHSSSLDEEDDENLEKACDENVRVDNFVKAYPRLALLSNTLSINPFKYKNLSRVNIFNLKNNFPNRTRKSTVNRNVYTTVKVTNLLRNREITGKKHSYKYKRDQSLQKETVTTLNVHYSWH